MNAAEQTEIWDRYEAGESVTVIAAAIGRPLSTVWGLVVRHGHRRPPGPPAWSSARLSLADREEISRRLVAGDSLRAIGRCLGRAPSTISLEVSGNGGRKAYRAVKAEDRVRASVKRPKVARLAANTALAELVEEKLGEWWSPEQIAGWLRLTKAVLKQNKRGVYHLNGMERLEGVQYYSEEVKGSVYITGRTHLVGTLGVTSGGDFFIDDAMGSVRYTIENVDGEVIGTVSGTMRWTGGVVEVVRSNIDGVCSMPYEPAE